MGKLDSILELHDHAMIYELQAEFNRVRGSFDLENQKAALGSYNIFESEFKELIQAVKEENYHELRDGIGDVITTILALAYLIDMDISYKQLKDVYIEEFLYPCEDYRCYVDSIYKSVELLKAAILNKDIEETKRHIVGVLARTYLCLPEFARFSIRDDLVQVTKASLSKICPTEEDAKLTVAKYAEEGCETHYKPTPTGGFAIYSSKEQIFRGEKISENKFLKFYKWQEPKFEQINNEQTRWNHYNTKTFKALALIESEASVL